MRFTILLLLLGSSFYFNRSNKPVLTAVYATEVKFVTKMKIKMQPPKNAMDSMLWEATEQMARELSGKPVSLSLIDSVNVFADSALIHTAPKDQYLSFQGTMAKVKESFTVYKGGRFYSIRDGEQLPRDEKIASSFQPTGRFETIGNYKCEIFEATDSSMKVWACKALPSLLNPGVNVPLQWGGILKYESKSAENEIRCTIQSIHK